MWGDGFGSYNLMGWRDWAVGGVAATCALAALHGWPAVPKVRARAVLGDYCRKHRILSLTYDDGPGAVMTPLVLDLLRQANARATFFLLGSRVPGREQLLDRIAGAGHELGCHSMDHLHAWKCSPSRVVRDIDRGYSALSKWAPRDAVFRPPYGKLVFASWRSLRRRGAPIAFWTHDSGDTWRRLPDARQSALGVERDGGGVVLLHDHDRSDEGRRRFVLEATGHLLSVAKAQGLRILPVGAVLKALGAANGL